MDKETLSNYGWIVICVLVLACMLALATPFGNFVADGFRATYVSFWQGGENAIETVIKPSLPTPEQLQQTHKFEYYSSLYKRADGVNGAIADVNDGTIGLNADCDKKDAVAGIYTDKNGNVTVLLLKDTTETISIPMNKDMALNLGGKTIFFNIQESGAHMCMGTQSNTDVNIKIDGRLKGSKIKATSNNPETSICLFFIQDDCSYTFDTVDLEIEANQANDDCMMMGIQAGSQTEKIKHLIITNSNIKVTSSATNATAIAMAAQQTTIADTAIKLDVDLGEGYTSHAVANWEGNSKIKNCDIYSSDIAISAYKNANIEITETTIEAVAVNVMVSGDDATVYINDTTMKLDVPEGLEDAPQRIIGLTASASSGTHSENIRVYVNNVEVIAKPDAILLHLMYHAKYAKVHMSNINCDKNLQIRLHSSTSELHWSSKNPNKPEDFRITYGNGATAETLVLTDEIYSKP